MSSGVSSDSRHVAQVVPLVPAWRLSRAFSYAIPDQLLEKVEPGSLVRVPLGGRKVRGIVVDADASAGDQRLEDIAGIVIPTPLARPPMTELLDWVADRYVSPKGQTYARIVPPRVRAKRAEVGRSAEEGKAAEEGRADPPAPAEPKVLPSYERGQGLLDAIAEGRSGTWCLRVLLAENRGRLIGELVTVARATGGSAIVAVPEVRYGSTTLETISETFPDVCRVDSTVGDAARSGNWIALAGGAPLGAGGRGIVLAPVPDLRLIVVDEESHRTYKEDRSPRYDARRVAIERARLQGAICVLVSAAPSVETGGAAGSGAFGYVQPPRGSDRATRPQLEFVPKPTDRPISHELHERIRDALRAGGRVALLVPMGGYARALWCASCRRSIRCPRCEAGMVYGRSTKKVGCPRCKFENRAPDRCPHCGANEFRFVGAGSERLAEQLAKSFPRAKVVRMDADVTQDLERGRRIEADIYVTTWIGTKEAIRPDVALVGVLDADGLVRRPDFRSGERAYQALVEMAEWAGPADGGGRLLVQTDEAGHHALQAIARNDYSFFLERELRLREELSYPPYSELIKIQVSGEAREAVADEVSRIARQGGARPLGPIEAGIDEKRSELLLKCPSAAAITPGLRELMTGLSSATRLRIDVDPR